LNEQQISTSALNPIGWLEPSGTLFGMAHLGAPGGSKLGFFYINLRATADRPRYTLPTLAFHATATGRLFRGALPYEAGELPFNRRAWFCSEFADPEGRIG
jgi:uncharacterized protein (DUF885 family)